MSGRKLTVDEKHTAEKLYARDKHERNPTSPNASKPSPCSNAAHPPDKSPSSWASRECPSTSGVLGLTQVDWTNSPVARAGATESPCAPC
jgi:hypothetical protein